MARTILRTKQKKDWRGKKNTIESTCVQCGAKYYPNHKTSIFCSKKCNNASRKKKLSEGGITANPAPVRVAKALTNGSAEENGVMGIPMAQEGIANKALTTRQGSIELEQTEPEKVSYDALFDEYGRHTEAGKEFVADLHAARKRITDNRLKSNPALYEDLRSDEQKNREREKREKEPKPDPNYVPRHMRPASFAKGGVIYPDPDYIPKHMRETSEKKKTLSEGGITENPAPIPTRAGQVVIDTKALTTEDEKTPVKQPLSFMNQQLQDQTGIDWHEAMEEMTRMRNNSRR